LENDRELGEIAKKALNAFELGLLPSKGIRGYSYDKLRFGLYPSRASEMEKKSSDVTNFWKEIQNLEEEENAVRSASLGHLNIFGKTLSRYANAQEVINLSTNRHRKRRTQQELQESYEEFDTIRTGMFCL
ncbi:9287_t:CDS:2, partial [Ambispora leptoticha]